MSTDICVHFVLQLNSCKLIISGLTIYRLLVSEILKHRFVQRYINAIIKHDVFVKVQYISYCKSDDHRVELHELYMSQVATRNRSPILNPISPI